MPDEHDHEREVAVIIDALHRAGFLRSGDISAQRATMSRNIEAKLQQLGPRAGRFTACADVLLATFSTQASDELHKIFREYFTFTKHFAVPAQSPILAELDPALKECSKKDGWPNSCCVPAGCVSLCGDRHLRPAPPPIDSTTPDCLKRLCVGDGIWLHYMDLMGLPQILGVILDDYATRGRFPIFSGSREAIVVETMISLIKSGESSTVKDRWTLYRRSYGLRSEVSDKLNLNVNENSAFLANLHNLIRESSNFYRYNRLGDAIQAINNPGRPSVATLSAIRDIIGLLKKSFDSFTYGYNYSAALDGIVWVVATLGLVRNLRKQLGIPDSFDQPHEYIPAAYELLVTGRPITPSESNRYTIHHDLARYSRRILLDLEALPLESVELPELEAWLGLVEEQVEGFIAANRALTGVDLGAGDKRL